MPSALASPRSFRMRDILTVPSATDHAKRTPPRELCAKVRPAPLRWGAAADVAPRSMWRAGPAAPIATVTIRPAAMNRADIQARCAGTRLGGSRPRAPRGGTSRYLRPTVSRTRPAQRPREELDSTSRTDGRAGRVVGPTNHSSRLPIRPRGSGPANHPRASGPATAVVDVDVVVVVDVVERRAGSSTSTTTSTTAIAN